jgi:hypothetical protein
LGYKRDSRSTFHLSLKVKIYNKEKMKKSY